MKTQRRFKLSTQINLIFTAITLVTSILFLLIFNQTIKDIIKKQTDRDHANYHEQVYNAITNNLQILDNKHYGYVEFIIEDIYRLDLTILRKDTNNIINDNQIKILAKSFIVLNTVKENYREKVGNITVIGSRLDASNNRVFMTISAGSYARSLGTPISNLVSVGFISIIILGNAIILLWSSVTVEKIKRLESEVSNLSKEGYSNPVVVEGSDELTDLANTIENMRLEILENENVKQDILQNISHDIKTPIAVIQSYAEAIIDGISEPKEASIILKQTEVLKRKTKQLLEWNKLEYLKDEKDFELINMKEVILNVVNNHKYHSKINFELDLDDTKYLGVSENYYSVVSNIIDNALRYANTVIKVTLKDDILRFYNDGDHISENFINHIFKPYEKGHKGQFGLGMTIVQKTLTSFNMNLTIKNLDTGVIFIIKPNYENN